MLNIKIKFLRKDKNKNLLCSILNELKDAGYDYGVAIATKAEIEAGAACGQLSLVLEDDLA